LENNFYNPQNSPIKELIHFVWQVERINFEITQETILPKGIIEIILISMTIQRFLKIHEWNQLIRDM